MRTPFLLLCLILNSPTIAQPTLPADIQAKVDAHQKAGGTVEYHIRDRAAEGVGASGQATGDKTDLKVDQTAPIVSLPGASASGGDNKASGSASLVSGDLLRLLVLIVGALYLAAAGVCVWRRWNLPRAPIVLGAIGLGLLVLSGYLTVLVLGLLAGMTLLVVQSLLDGRGLTRFKEALRAVAAGVSDLTPEAQAPVLASISAHAEEADKATIKRIKREDELK